MDDRTVNMDATPGDTSGASTTGMVDRPIRRFFLAGVGAAAVACDVAEQTFDRFVRRGEEVQRDVQERTDAVRSHNRGTADRVSESLRSGMDVVLNSLNLPSKTDVDTVNVKLNILTRKLDDLQMRQEPSATVTEIILPPGAEEAAEEGT